MRIVFLGTPEFAVPSLDALSLEHEIVAVITQPDRKKDRKGNFVAGAVKCRAAELGIPVYQFEKIRTDGVEKIKTFSPDVMVTCAYGQILSREILDIPRLGVLNVHGSLLPKYRGSSPIQRALMNGEKTTGVTIMKTDVGMDSGAILDSEEIVIEPDDYVTELYDKLAAIGAKLLVKTLDKYEKGLIKPVPQDETKVTFAPLLRKEEAFLDFNESAEKLRNTVRGMGYSVCSFRGESLKIYRADLCENPDNLPAGEIITAKKNVFAVACGVGALKLTELQLSGKKSMNASDFLNGTQARAGERLGKVTE